MKVFSILIVCFLLSSFSAQTQPLKLSELDSASYFDFWVGTWRVFYDQGEGVREYGTNVIDKILDGAVIRETFELASGNSAGFKGTSLSVFQPRFNRWKQAWADNQGGYFDFEGEFSDDKRIFKTKVFDRGDKRIQQRMVFYDIKPNSFTWDWEMSEDGGESWRLSWRIFYERK